jgi:hypothetical protein
MRDNEYFIGSETKSFSEQKELSKALEEQQEE